MRFKKRYLLYFQLCRRKLEFFKLVIFLSCCLSCPGLYSVSALSSLHYASVSVYVALTTTLISSDTRGSTARWFASFTTADVLTAGCVAAACVAAGFHPVDCCSAGFLPPATLSSSPSCPAPMAVFLSAFFSGVLRHSDPLPVPLSLSLPLSFSLYLNTV